MPSTATEISQLRQAYSLEYQGLSPVLKQIVRLYSVIYEPISRSKFLQCLVALGEKTSQGKTFTSGSLKPHFEYLLEQELLVQERGQSPQCNVLIAEIATRDAIAEGIWEDMVKIANTHLPIPTLYSSKQDKAFKSLEQLIREVRIGVYRQDMTFIRQQLDWYDKYNYYDRRVQLEDLLNLLLNNPFDPDWFSQLPAELYELGLINILGSSFINLSAATPAFVLLQATENKSNLHFSDNLRLILVEQLLLRDDLESAKQHLEQVSSDQQELTDVFWGWIFFLEGNYTKAIEVYGTAYKSLKKKSKKKKVFFDSIVGIFFILALLQDGSPDRLKEAESYCKIMATNNSWLSYTYAWLFKLLQIQQGDMSQKDWIYENRIDAYENSSSIETFFCSLCLYWLDQDAAKKRVPSFLKDLSDRAEATGYYWLSVEAAELLFRLKINKDRVTEINNNSAAPYLVDLIKTKQPWELSLQALANLQKPTQSEAKLASAKRLTWLLKLRSDSFMRDRHEASL